jgi:CRP-like cAMP-binding protein
MQTAVCNRHHRIKQQLAKWILEMVDRVRGNQFRMTQVLIADMLGVRREQVSRLALSLQGDGAIRYSRGRIEVIDRPLLEREACECYQVTYDETRRLLQA